MKHELTHARHDPAHCLAPGLFRSLHRDDRRKLKLNVIYEFGDNQRIEFSGPEPLGADDLRVLQGLVAMAGPSGKLLKPDTESEMGAAHREGLRLKWDAKEDGALVVTGSYRALAREIGYADIEQTRQIQECIERLWKVSIIVQSADKRRKGFRLLSEYSSTETTGQLNVALNPRITTAICGDQPFTRINMHEVRALKLDAARIIHQRLSWINPGKSGSVTLDTICSYAWPEPTEVESTRKKRKASARKALAELQALGWDVDEYVRGKFTIKRPAPAKEA